MKTILIKIIGLINTTFYRVIENKILLNKTKLYLVKFITNNDYHISMINSNINKTNVYISGENNSITVNYALMSGALITIKGTNNKLIIESGVEIINSTINIRGNNCSIKIGQGTYFGGIRIVNVGINNTIEIGQNCLFSDFIELWASDTHSIFNSEGELINPERPITIGNNVWVGSHVKILKGVSIGEGAVIGMNTLVTKDVLPKTLCAGNPMRCLKEGINWSPDYRNN